MSTVLDFRPGWHMRAVRDAEGLSAGARLTGLVLGTYRSARTGLAWPSVETLAAGAGLSRRAIQRGLRELEAAGLIRVAESHRHGRGYQFEGRPTDAPEGRQTDAPRATRGAPQTTLRGATDDIQGRHTDAQTIDRTIDRTIEGNLTVSPRARKTAPKPIAKIEPQAFPRPAGVEPQVWRDFLANRKRKRMANTATAHKRLCDDLARLADDEWPPGRLVEYAAAKGWGGIYDPREQERSHGNPRAYPERSTANAVAIARANLAAARH